MLMLMELSGKYKVLNDDSEYAVCYFKLLEAKPMVTQLVPSPFQHMKNTLVQQAATYPNNIPISGKWVCLLNCHFCGIPGCRIGTHKVVNKYAKASHVIHDGKMVLHVNKSPIAWNSQGLRVSVDARSGGPLLVLAEIPKDQGTVQIQTLFVTGTPVEDKGDISEKEDVEGKEEDVPVATFTTTRPKAKNISSPNIIKKPALRASANNLPADKNPDIPLQSTTKKNP